MAHSRLIGSGPDAWRHAVALACAAAIGLLLVCRLRGRDRRDRRRVVGLLAAHVVVAIGLPAVSACAAGTGGPVPAAFATFVEGSGKAFTAGALLVAVPVGVLPRRRLPAAVVAVRRHDRPTGERHVRTRLAA